jgi:hypothetical protein
VISTLKGVHNFGELSTFRLALAAGLLPFRTGMNPVRFWEEKEKENEKAISSLIDSACLFCRTNKG